MYNRISTFFILWIFIFDFSLTSCHKDTPNFSPTESSTDSIRNDTGATDSESTNSSTSSDLDFPDTIKNIPHIYIDVDNGDIIKSRSHYLKADIKIEGKGKYGDYEGRTKIRGRGNTSWSYSKKPYKLKLIEKASLFGLAAYKKWILLANWRDGSLLANSIPYEMGHLLNLPYTNHIIPVELTLNGEYVGLYVFTEYKEVGKNRIDIGKGKDAGVLLEIDTYYDEPYEFKSTNYDLPVMIKYPKLDKWENEEEIDSRFAEIKQHFNDFEALVYSDDFPKDGYLEKFDADSYVNYLIIYLLTDNSEINRPKSTYINKKKHGKYRMGIIWDFDAGFGYDSHRSFFKLNTAEDDLFWNNRHIGTKFFHRFLEDPVVVQLLQERWRWFRDKKYDSLIQHVKDYATLVRGVYKKDHKKWGKRKSTGDFDRDLNKVLAYLDKRAAYLDGYIAGL